MVVGAEGRAALVLFWSRGSAWTNGRLPQLAGTSCHPPHFPQHLSAPTTPSVPAYYVLEVWIPQGTRIVSSRFASLRLFSS